MGVDAAVGIEGHQGKFPDGFYFQILSVGLNNLQKVCGRSIGIHKNMVQNSHPSKAEVHQKDQKDDGDDGDDCEFEFEYEWYESYEQHIQIMSY